MRRATLMHIIPIAAQAFPVACAAVSAAPRRPRDHSRGFSSPERFPAFDRRGGMAMAWPGAVTPFSYRLIFPEGSGQDVPVPRHGELQVKKEDG
jgi:hypothetical protein